MSESDCEVIYQAYPRHVGKRTAMLEIDRSILRLLKGEGRKGLFKSKDDAIVFLLQRVQLYASSPAGRNGEFTPHPSTWFHQSRYLDDESEWSKKKTSSWEKFMEAKA